MSADRLDEISKVLLTTLQAMRADAQLRGETTHALDGMIKSIERIRINADRAIERIHVAYGEKE
jgi:hypothetical protein